MYLAGFSLFLYESRVWSHAAFTSLSSFRRDPSSDVGFSDILYDNDKFAEAISRALSDDGVMVTQVGQEDFIDDPAKEFTNKQYEFKLRTHLQNHGFVVAKDYSEAHGGFLGVWRYLILFKSRESLVYWYANQAEIDLEIRKRSLTIQPSGNSAETTTPFRYFDGAMMMTYQFPSRVSEEVFCRSTPQPDLCATKHGLDPEIENVPISSLEVRQSSLPNAGRGISSKESVKKGMYIAADEMVESILFPPKTYLYAKSITEKSYASANSYFKALDAYIHGYGFENDLFGNIAYSVEPSILTFINHGCNRTYNQGAVTLFTEMDVDSTSMPEMLKDNIVETIFYSPFIDRNLFGLMHANEVTLRDIEAGEELLGNYLHYWSEENWESKVNDFRAMCSLQGVGTINRYQDEQASSQEKEE
jgi:hypothetical protein